MYCRFESGIHPRENVVDIVCTLKDHIESLDDHRLLLETVCNMLYCKKNITFAVVKQSGSGAENRHTPFPGRMV